MKDEEQNEEARIELKMTSANPEQPNKQRQKICDEDPYIVKLFKSLIGAEKKKDTVEKKS